MAADKLLSESGSRANSQERETIPGWCAIVKASSGRTSSLEKIFDYVGPVCSVFISYTPSGIVLNCHCPKTHEIEMNCAFLCSLTVKYFTSPQSSSPAFASAGMTPDVSTAWHSCCILHVLSLIFFSLWPHLHGYRLSMPWLINKCTCGPLKSQVAARIHMGMCLYVCLTACEIHICVGRERPCKQFRYVANIIHKLFWLMK